MVLLLSLEEEQPNEKERQGAEGAGLSETPKVGMPKPQDYFTEMWCVSCRQFGCSMDFIS